MVSAENSLVWNDSDVEEVEEDSLSHVSASFDDDWKPAPSLPSVPSPAHRPCPFKAMAIPVAAVEPPPPVEEVVAQENEMAPLAESIDVIAESLRKKRSFDDVDDASDDELDNSRPSSKRSRSTTPARSPIEELAASVNDSPLLPAPKRMTTSLFGDADASQCTLRDFAQMESGAVRETVERYERRASETASLKSKETKEAEEQEEDEQEEEARCTVVFDGRKITMRKLLCFIHDLTATLGMAEIKWMNLGLRGFAIDSVTFTRDTTEDFLVTWGVPNDKLPTVFYAGKEVQDALGEHEKVGKVTLSFTHTHKYLERMPHCIVTPAQCDDVNMVLASCGAGCPPHKFAQSLDQVFAATLSSFDLLLPEETNGYDAAGNTPVDFAGALSVPKSSISFRDWTFIVTQAARNGIPVFSGHTQAFVGRTIDV